MKRQFRITEKQYKHLMKEGVTLNADVAAAGGDINKAVDTTRQEAQKNGVDLTKATIQIPGAAANNESKVISMQTIRENRLKALKKHSKLYNFSDFIKNKKS